MRVGSIVVWSNRALGVASAAVVFVMVGVVTYGVLMRYIFKSPTAFAIELPSLLFIAAIAFCLGYTQLHKRHVRVELVTSRLPAKLQYALHLLSSVVVVGYSAFVVWSLWRRFVQYAAVNEVARESRIPVAPFVFAIVLGVVFLALQVIIEVRSAEAATPKEAEGHGKVRGID
ncbi:MAG: TRAP transporter small permease [Chloroflexi bacterium]|nr:TRAP transporter small permease [Chloroflexota bacterium]